MQADNETIHFNIVLPTPKLPPALSHITNTPTAQFLVGYRNVLTAGETGVSWGLVKNSNYCGRSFVFEITQTEAHNIQQIKQPGEFIEMVGHNYILLKIEKQIQKPSQPLTNEQALQLLEDIGGNNQINASLVKSAFDSYEQYSELAEKSINAVIFKEIVKETQVVERVQQQFHAKKFSGKALLEVPLILKETGNWSQEQNSPLKISSH